MVLIKLGKKVVATCSMIDPSLVPQTSHAGSARVFFSHVVPVILMTLHLHSAETPICARHIQKQEDSVIAPSVMAIL
jgi:hypothetical protein